MGDYEPLGDALIEAFRVLEAERDAARAEAALSKQETHAVEHMLVRRLGGTVEGAPTSTVNYLQRVDELREIERVSDALRARVAVLEAALREALPIVQAYRASVATKGEAYEDKESRAHYCEMHIETALKGAQT